MYNARDCFAIGQSQDKTGQEGRARNSGSRRGGWAAADKTRQDKTKEDKGREENNMVRASTSKIGSRTGGRRTE
eukprot:168171-Hanusia_phi.AAC.2